MTRSKKVERLLNFCSKQKECHGCKLNKQEDIVMCDFMYLNDTEIDALMYRVFGTSVTDSLTGVVKEEPKTIPEILEEVSNEICDHYCKYPNEITDQEEMQQKCINCPLQKLN